MIDFQGPTETSAFHKKGYTLFEEKPKEDAEDESLSFFLSQERYWNNEIRKLALGEGIHHFFPKVFFLLRPETALTSCLHFLAKELGGFTDFEQQRDFIFNKPGLMKLTKTFFSPKSAECSALMSDSTISTMPGCTCLQKNFETTSLQLMVLH